ncbi:hypothetical protein M9H77_12333 [Catharanthus roseus]|uniref:Uncharacterized protein n=1 Tax=Catharanthus roseus TaxID=4058 RepID=A0ACC0BH49_CATRO|nr:hypothetical protein M9H77_12333 [Catharanthus roseus]
MVQSRAHRGDDDLGPVTDRIGRVHDCTVTASSRGVRGCHSISDIPCTPTPLGLGIYYDLGASRSSTQPLYIPVGLVLLSHHTIHTLPYPMRYMDLLSHHLSPHIHHMTRMHMVLLCLHIYLARIYHCIDKYQQPLNEVSGLGLQLGAFFEQLVSGVPVDSSYNTADYTVIDYGFPSSDPCHGRDSSDIGLEGDRSQFEEHDIVGSLHIGGEDDDSDEDEHVPIAPVFVAPTSSTDVRSGSGKGKGLTGSFVLVVMLIPSYSGHIAGSIWGGQSDLGITYSGGGTNAQELVQVAENPDSGLSPEHRLHATSSIYLEVHSSPIRVVTSSRQAMTACKECLRQGGLHGVL